MDLGNEYDDDNLLPHIMMMMIIASCSQFCRIYGHVSYWKGKWNKWNGRNQNYNVFCCFGIFLCCIDKWICFVGYMAMWAIRRVNGTSGMEGMKVTMYFVVLAFFFCIDKWICRFSYVIVACPFLLQLVDFQGVATTWTNWFHVLCCDVEYCDRMGRILSIKLPNVLPLEFLYLYFRFQ
jgi:hypothetical protein